MTPHLWKYNRQFTESATATLSSESVPSMLEIRVLMEYHRTISNKKQQIKSGDVVLMHDEYLETTRI